MTKALRTAWGFACSRAWVLPVLLGCAFHLPALFGELVYDDIGLILDHPAPTTWPEWLAIWQRDYGFDLSSRPFGFYRPGLVTLVAVIRALAGNHPLAFHLLCLGVFVLAIGCVVRLAALLDGGQSRRLPVVAGILYALHPARVETVSLVTSLPDLILELGALVFACLLLTAMRETRPTRAWRIPAACGLLCLAVATCKESAFLLLPVLAATAGLHALVAPSSQRGRLGAAALAACIGLAIGWLLRMQANVAAPVPLTGAVGALLGSHACGALRILLLALRDVVVPGPAVLARPFVGFACTGAGVLIAFLGVALVLCWLLAWRRRQFGLALLLAWTGTNALGILLLAANQYTYAPRYLALAPWVLLLCLGAAAVARRLTHYAPPGIRATPQRRAAWLLLALYLAAQGGYTLAGSAQYLTPLRVVTALCELFPANAAVVGNMAELLNQDRQPAADVEVFVRRATTLNAEHPQVPHLHNLLLQRYLDEQRYADVIRCADWSLGIHSNDADKVVLRAAALANLGRTDLARQEVDQVLASHPGHALARQLQQQLARTTNAVIAPTGY